MQIKLNRKFGFTLVEIMIVVAIIGLLAAIAIPNFAKARSLSRARACMNNLRLIDGAIQQAALEKGLKTSDTATASDVIVYLGRGTETTGVAPTCPEGNVAYSSTFTVGTMPVCPQVSTYTNHVLAP